MATIYCTATSLDGYIADDGESLSWLFATPGHDTDPQGRYGDGESLDFDQFLPTVGALVCGASTYAWVHRELTADGQDFVWPYEQPSWVVTHRDLDLPDGVRAFAGDVRDLHAVMTEAAAGKDLWVVGGGDLAGQFADVGLLDKVWVHLNPVTLGAGKPLLPRRLRLHRERIERDGQFTAMLFDVVGPEPRRDGDVDGAAEVYAEGGP
ncbi:dihydrofolate reductase family protein [Janibacter corallicola]|uniref:dihydrofolate reductase family protein n=1 Tax=Janibacter corallicola TaxID=415212 RepID=UPI000836D28D|nr:dihydrofolate reductase family protein [Janibacter corallicola]